MAEAEAWMRVAAQLIRNGIRFRYLRRSRRCLTGKVPKAQAMSIEITRRCVARCRMCNIWRVGPNAPELAATDWLNLLSRPFFSELVELDVTGGEPFLRDDLADLLISICKQKQRHLTALTSIAVTTNGFLTRRVLHQCGRILAPAGRLGIDLVVVCAMDGVGEGHDHIRRYPGGWGRLHETIGGLCALRERHANLIVGLKTTVLPQNADQLEAISQYARTHGLFTIISPCIITPGRYLNVDRAGDLAFDQRSRAQMVRFFSTPSEGWSYHHHRLREYLNTGRMRKPCTSGYNYFFIRSQGDLMLCPLVEESPGNLLADDLEILLSSLQAHRLRRRLTRLPQCRHCTEPGIERYSLPYEGFAYLSLLAKLGRRRFFELHSHMGLDKYLA
jgi:MoaA/NifB/PqqE/SkfB family radical SAM enzyme